jgi:SAM-dependent methyltransferase
MAIAPDGSRSQRVLWVEGKDDSAVTQSLCLAHELPRAFEVHAKSGVEEVLDTFSVGLKAPNAERFGLVVDADGNAQARWDSIRRTLEEAGYHEVPERLNPDGVVLPAVPHRPAFGAWIMPDNGSAGSLEDFAAALVAADDDLWTRAKEAVNAIPEERRRFPAARQSKALIHTWLSWQEDPGSPMGQAITKGDLDANAPAARSFVSWLRRLFVD